MLPLSPQRSLVQFCRIEPLTPPTILEPGWYAFVRDDRIVLSLRLTEPTPRSDLASIVHSVLRAA